MLAPALVLLGDEDTDAPALPGVATVSTDDAWDSGAYGLGVAAAQAGRLWCDRPYFTGNPTVDWMVAKADRVAAAGGYCQLGNEQNLALEDWSGGVAAWWAFDAGVRERVAFPHTVLAMPPSPGTPDWADWITPSGPYAVHAYGTRQQMQEIVQHYLDHTAGDLYVTECNPGAGQSFDLAAWAESDLDPFLDWCAGQPRVQCCAYFAWRWDQSATLPASVDAASCPELVAVLERPRSPAAEPPPAGFDIEVVRDDLWTIADGLEQAGWPWFGQGIKALVDLSKGGR